MVNDAYQTYNSKNIQQQKKNHSKSNIPKHVFIECVSTTTNHSFIKINSALSTFHISMKIV